ncbi:PEP-CTERM sorting domain-containing protein [Botrimarina sp.]|uniref:PEP-CTERM sorting domain-containing protein n=1 Tax=Botrimarina sp. TaxID=2795802 RepID=UPI0032EC38A2
MNRFPFRCSAVALTMLIGLGADAAHLDGADIPTGGLTLQATQDTPTGFGNSSGTQESLGGSELNALYADIEGRKLTIGITGNLEANFNKLFIFFDATDGGEASLAGDNADGGFGEINNLQGLMFEGGATMDHGLRFELGGGFLGVRFFDLIDNTASDVFTAGGPGSLPAEAAGNSAVMVGWDNSNAAGVDGSSAAGAGTATTGIELEIDLIEAFGATQGDIGISAIITSGDATFLSNQALPGLNGASNLGSPSGQTLPVAVVPGAPIPEPTAAALLGLAALATASRRR